MHETRGRVHVPLARGCPVIDDRLPGNVRIQEGVREAQIAHPFWIDRRLADGQVILRRRTGFPVTDRLPPFGKNVLACSNLAVTYFMAYVSPQDGKWHLSAVDTVIQHITH